MSRRSEKLNTIIVLIDVLERPFYVIPKKPEIESLRNRLFLCNAL